MIVVVDSGIANVGSIANMLKKLGIRANVSAVPAEIEKASKLILPGVGAFDAGMRHMRDLGLVEPLNEAVLGRSVPVLGICLGMQLMSRGSEEGLLPGLGWLDTRAVRFNFDGAANGASYRVPHMGWNTVRTTGSSPLFSDLGDDARFYFVHSYHIVADDPGVVLASTQYGYDFVSAVAKKNIFGVQFHPEKSHRYGLQLIRNFVQQM